MRKKITFIARIGLGLAFLIFGIDGLILVAGLPGFLPMPPRIPAMSAAMNEFYALQYFMPLVKIIETSTAIMFLTNQFVRLAIVLISPIVVNIFFMRIFLDPKGHAFTFLAILFIIAIILIIIDRWSFFKQLFKRKE